MNILLVNPRFNGKSEIPPLGLASVASPLLEADINVLILDLDIGESQEMDERLLKCLKEFKPAMVGVTSLSNSFASARHVFETVKAVNPEILTVLGGIHATVLFDKLLEDYGAIDVIVRGEGEITFLELARHFIHLKPFSGIQGISYRQGHHVAHNEDSPLIRDLDSFPMPAHHLIKGDCYRTRSISSSRGCIHECTFCSIQSQYHRIVRCRSTNHLIEEIQGLVYFGAKRIMFTDDNFTFSLKRVRDLCAEMIRQGFKRQVAFYAQGRLDDICRNPVMAGMLSEAGFQALYIGAESGSSDMLDYYQKGIHPDEVRQGVSFCVEQNLTPVVNFILLGPKDRPDTIRQTIRLAKQLFENGAEIVYTETLIPYPGTPIKEELERDGRFRETQGAYYFQSYHNLDMDWFLRLCDGARVLTKLFHKDDLFFDTRKTYYELSYLDHLLEGRIPPDLEACRRDATGHFSTDEIEALYDQTRELIKPLNSH